MDELEQSIIEKVMRQLMSFFSQMQFQGIVHPVEPEVVPAGCPWESL